MPFLGLFFNTKNRTNVLFNLCNLLIEHRRRSYWFLPQEEEKRNFWEKDEIKTFLEKAHSQLEQQDYVMFYVLIFTGMRKGELLALEWRDVDLKEKTSSKQQKNIILSELLRLIIIRPKYLQNDVRSKKKYSYLMGSPQKLNTCLYGVICAL
ncbi:tyrosine-type recombinase/integrase [Bacillus paralicheniformis]|uniref:tyrosine-type recombinase/integrase n=1 Tax=Bacillus paralicheniformis TaxID=1648923 RepID=UPI003D1CCBEB